MEKMKHTPGPWYPSFHAGICIGVQNSPDGFTQMICNSILPETDDMYEKWGEQIEADMKLIAAAPDLLEALEKAQRLLTMAATEVQRTEIHRYLSGGFKESVEDACFKDSLKIEEAIRKARGL